MIFITYNSFHRKAFILSSRSPYGRPGTTGSRKTWNSGINNGDAAKHQQEQEKEPNLYIAKKEMTNPKEYLRPIEYYDILDKQKKEKKRGWFHCFYKHLDEGNERVLAEIEDEQGNMTRTYSHLIKFLDR